MLVGNSTSRSVVSISCLLYGKSRLRGGVLNYECTIGIPNLVECEQYNMVFT